MMHSLLKSCAELSGIGPQNLSKLHRLNIHHLYDLLRHLPFRYQDRTRVTPIRDLQHLQPAVVEGQITSCRWLSAQRRIYQCSLDDGSGILHLKFFHLPGFLQKRLQPHETLRVFGEMKYRQGEWELIHPEIEFQDESASKPREHFTPYYPSTQGLQQGFWRKIIEQTFEQFPQEIAALEWLSPQQLDALKLPSLSQALTLLHFPSSSLSWEDLVHPGHPARSRLALEEFVAYFLSNLLLKQEQISQTAYTYQLDALLEQNLLNQLPFSLTQAQARVHREIQQDLAQTKPMLRLLQGDVGAGKTIICALAALGVLDQGHQVALMAPTDLLSEQHYHTMTNWLSPLGFTVLRLNRNISSKTKKQHLLAIASGDAQLIVGTHALFQDQVKFKHLGLIIIDEQHRFGVAQRLKLLEKSQAQNHPHQLFVTATPIPRTLAMTQFSHFDVSILDELPKGRQSIKTAVIRQDKRCQLLPRLQEVMQNKGQIYWVCTRIEDDDAQDQIAVTALRDYLLAKLPKARIGLVHGKLKPLEKDKIMQGFKQQEFDILVATTVIEVGVDVPNANIMIIENAQHLGLAQLHQLRGRVGRGQKEAYCILMYNSPLSEHGQQRLATIRESNDGFWLAEQDLKLRGAGDIFGKQQTGFDEFKLAKLPWHLNWLNHAKTLAEELMLHHPERIQTILAAWYAEGQRFLKS